MAYNLPTIPDDKIQFYRQSLIREVSNLFEWENLPDSIPQDFLEYTLITEGRVMFFYELDTFGYMCLPCGVQGYNVYRRPVTAFAVAPNTDGYKTRYERNIVYKYTPDIDPSKGCVLIENIYGGQPLIDVINFYALRMAMVQQAFDTNCLWQNVPVIFPVPDQDTRLSIERLFADIYSGKPWVIVDNFLMAGEKPIQAGVTPVPFLLDQLLDALNELRAKWHEEIGINTAGADKKERLLTDEVNANNQAIKTTLQIMLSQREKACEEISNLFPDLSPSVKVRGQEEERYYIEDGLSEEGDGDGTDNY